jgi:hypothetical protein
MHCISNINAGCGLNVQKKNYLFFNSCNNYIFNERLAPPVFQPAYSENSHSKGFQRSRNIKTIYYKNRKSCKSLPHAGSVESVISLKLNIFFCRKQNRSNFGSVIKTL